MSYSAFVRLWFDTTSSIKTNSSVNVAYEDTKPGSASSVTIVVQKIRKKRAVRMSVPWFAE